VARLHRLASGCKSTLATVGEESILEVDMWLGEALNIYYGEGIGEGEGEL
jgi:hypothetical protein